MVGHCLLFSNLSTGFYEYGISYLINYKHYRPIAYLVGHWPQYYHPDFNSIYLDEEDYGINQIKDLVLYDKLINFVFKYGNKKDIRMLIQAMKYKGRTVYGYQY